MKTKACPPLLVACAMLSAPASAGAATFTLSGVHYLTGTLTGTFDFNIGAFSNFNITATGGSFNGIIFNQDNTSTPTAIMAKSSFNSSASLQLTLFASLPTSPDQVTGGLISIVGGPAEVPVGGFVATTSSAVPLPGALSLFASGLGALGLLGWRRKRKAQATI